MASVRSLVFAVLSFCAVATAASAQQSIRPITLARLDHLIKGLEAEKAFWGPIWARDRKTADSVEHARPQMDASDPGGLRKRAETYESCKQGIAERDPEVKQFIQSVQGAMAKMTTAQQMEFGQAANQLQQRQEAAEATNDAAAIAAIDADVGALYVKYLGMTPANYKRLSTRIRTQTMQQCGRAVHAPTQQEQDSIANAMSSQPEVTVVSDTLTSDVGMRASGLGDSYPLLRELITMYLASPESYSGRSEGALTAAERAAIKQREVKLKALLEFLDSRGGWDS